MPVRERLDEPDRSEPADRTAAPAGVAAPSVDRVLALQRSAGNAAVSGMLTARRTLARDGTPGADPAAVPAPAPPAPRQDYVFYMGDVKNDPFFVEAKLFFEKDAAGAQRQSATSLDEIIDVVNAGQHPAGRIIIVTHGHADGTMQFKLHAKAKEKSIDYFSLRDANANRPSELSQADAAKVDKDTRILIRGCNVGRSKATLDALDQAFGGAASVSAPTHEQSYAHDAAGPRETFSGLFYEEKGDARTKYPDVKSLVAAFSAKYSFVDPKEWPALLAPVISDTTGKMKIFDRQGPWSLDVGTGEKAPSQAELETMARADLSRPDVYAFTPVKSAPAGNGMTRYMIFAERTEFRARHQEIKKGGAPYEPPAADRGQWWGDSTFGNPPPPTAPGTP